MVWSIANNSKINNATLLLFIISLFLPNVLCNIYLHYLDNFKIQEKDNPFPDNAVGRTEHRERLNTAIKSVNESTNLDLPPPKNPIDLDNLQPPINVKPGELIDIFDAKGNIVNVPIIKVSKSGNSIKVSLSDGSEKIISLDPASGAYQNIRNPNYVIRTSGLNIFKTTQKKTVSELSKEEISIVRKQLLERKQKLEQEGATNQGIYADTIQDLNSIDFLLINYQQKLTLLVLINLVLIKMKAL